jgi:RimJ/RimL family protein N-acetyltransferase
VPPILARPLRTKRLTLRPATVDDAEATFEYRRLESVSQWLLEVPTDLETYAAAFADPARLTTTVIVELGDKTIGDFVLALQDPLAQVEVADQARNTQASLGGVLHPAYTARGYALEAVAELLRYSFEELGLRRVVGICFADNDAVLRLMERVGMRREAYMVRDALHRSGRWLDSVRYAILADEWAAAAAEVR